jgi:Calcineurin-like phosphoesterase
MQSAISKTTTISSLFVLASPPSIEGEDVSSTTQFKTSNDNGQQVITIEAAARKLQKAKFRMQRQKDYHRYDALVITVCDNMLIDVQHDNRIGDLFKLASKLFPSIFRLVYIQKECSSSTLLLLAETMKTRWLNDDRADAVVYSHEMLECANKLFFFNHFAESTVFSPNLLSVSHQNLEKRDETLRRLSNGITTFRMQQRMSWSKLLHRHTQEVEPTYSIQKRAGNGDMIRIVHVSDTHNQHRLLNIPPGDLFIHSGDICGFYSSQCDIVQHFCDFLTWLHDDVCPKFQQVIFIGGNHDVYLDCELCPIRFGNHGMKICHDANQALAKFLDVNPNVSYLNQSNIIFKGLNIYGNSFVPCRVELENKFYLSSGFERTSNVRETIWNNAPTDIDIIVTHCPPDGIGSPSHPCCCPIMSNYIYGTQAQEKQRKHPILHLFGHIHTLFGTYFHMSADNEEATILMNGAQPNVINMDPVGGGIPLVFDLPIPNRFNRV